jgi:hypothetical protein
MMFFRSNRHLSRQRKIRHCPRARWWLIELQWGRYAQAI